MFITRKKLKRAKHAARKKLAAMGLGEFAETLRIARFPWFSRELLGFAMRVLGLRWIMLPWYSAGYDGRVFGSGNHIDLVIIHEAGHILLKQLSEAKKERLLREISQTPPCTPYGEESPEEDFCEALALIAGGLPINRRKAQIVRKALGATPRAFLLHNPASR